MPHDDPRPTAPQPPVPDAATLDAEAHRLLDFARASALPTGGFGHLSATGAVLPDRPVELWVTGRMTYSFALGALLGRPGDAALVDHGLAALTGPFRDEVHGGWFASVDTGGRPVDDTKASYPHAFVVLATAAASLAGRDGATALLAEALDVVDRHLWEEGPGTVLESTSRDFTTAEDYRGVNANMHAVEAFLAAADALAAAGERGAEEQWRARAGRIVERAVHGSARDAGWRLPEHFDGAWTPLPAYNADDRAHPFRPYGVTPGHGLEWSRLALHLRAAERAGAPGTEAGGGGRPWLLDDARALYDRAVADGWARDGHDGFVYTTGHDGAVSVPARMHWVLTEAIGAAAALFQATGQQRYADDHARWWHHARALFVDLEGGSWHHELDAEGRPAAGTWAGKPDVYHALQATLVPRLPLAPTFAAALAARGGGAAARMGP